MLTFSSPNKTTVLHRRQGFRRIASRKHSRIEGVKTCDICAASFVPVTSRQKRCSTACNSVASNTKKRKDPTRKKCRTCLQDLPVSSFSLRHRSCINCEELAASGRKRCQECTQVKEAGEFHKRSSRPDGLDARCKSCRSARSRVRNADPERRAAARDAKYRTRYGITVAQVQEMLENQDRKCGICGSQLEKPVVDHDHSSGAVRELLCSPCNSIIGLAREDISILNSAISYLKRYST